MTGLITPTLLALAINAFAINGFAINGFAINGLAIDDNARPPAAGEHRLSSPRQVQFRGGNWRDHPLMYRGNWEAHNRAWDALEGHGSAKLPRCARYRSYDPATQTFVGRDGRRLRCR